MSVELLGVIVNDHGAPVLPVGNPAGEKAFYKLFYETATGKKLRPLLTEAVNDRVLDITNQQHAKGREITLNHFVQIIEDLFIAKDPALFPPAPEQAAVVVDDRPRNADGRFKSEFQIFSEQHSAFDCTERAKIDPEYRAWRQDQYRVEGVQEGPFRLAGTPQTEDTLSHRANQPSDRVADFARVYKSVPSDRLRARAGRVTLDEQHSYTPQEFELLVGLASSAGLL